MFLETVKIAWLSVISKIVEVLPGLIAALVLLMLGLVVGPIIGGLVARFVRALKIDRFSKKSGLKDALGAFGDISLGILLGKLVKWFIIIISIVAAADILKLDQVTDILSDLLFFIPDVITAVVILATGIVVGGVLESFVKKAAHGVDHYKTIAKVSRLSVIVFATLAALLQLGIAPSLIQILFAGVVLALALAFGLGGRAKAAETLDKMF